MGRAQPDPSAKKLGKALIKVLFVVAALGWVLYRTDPAQLGRTLGGLAPGWLLLALVLFNLSQVLSAARLQPIFRTAGAPLAFARNLRLYYVGMFYNLFLPGGIGGDAFKAYWLHRREGAPVGGLVAGLLLDRGAGLAALLLVAGALGAIVLERAWPLAAMAGVAAGYAGVVRLAFRRFTAIRWRVLTLSVGIQLLQGGTALVLAQALGGPGTVLVLLFYLSSVAALLPITIGGIGARELVFLYGAEWTGHPPEAGVALGLLFFALTAVSALAGARFLEEFPLRSGAGLRDSSG